MAQRMLLGKFFHTIDAKSRMNLPSKMRDLLGSSFIVTKSRNGCLLVYSLDEWTVLIDKIANAEGDTTTVKRYVAGNAAEVEIDKQGRILIPSELREHAGITKDVVVVGCTNYAEIWSREKWDEVDSAMTNEAMDEEIKKMGLVF